MRQEAEKEKTSINYNVNFYLTIQQLIASYAEYEDGLLQLEAETEQAIQNNGDGVDPDKARIIKEYNSLMRKTISQTQIHYETLQNYKDMKEKANDKILLAYKELNKQYVMKREDLKSYILLLNKYVVSKLMPELSQNAELKSIYS